jgi:hypothetical protein
MGSLESLERVEIFKKVKKDERFAQL